MIFDAAAFADTVHQIRRDLEAVDQAVAWLAPTAYENRTGGHVSPGDCRKCHGTGRRPLGCSCADECTCPPCKTCKGTGRYEVKGRLIEPHCPPDVETLPCTNCEPCDECAVAVIGDAGEIVIRRKHVADLLESAARHVDQVLDITKGVSGTVAKMANLVDRGASRLPGMEPPSVDPREVAEQVKRKNERVQRGEEPPPLAPIAKDAASTLRQKIKTQEAIDAAIAKRAKEGDKVGNRWRK